MDYKKLVGYGVGLYVVMFIYWSLLVAFGAGEASWGWYLGFVVTAVAAHYAGSKLGTKDLKDLLKYAVAWVVIMLALDAAISVRFTGWELFSGWQVYIGYAVLLLGAVSVAWCKCKACCSSCCGSSCSREEVVEIEDMEDEYEQTGM